MKITVRKIHCHKTNKMWFQENTSRGTWIDIPETISSCDGNMRYCLNEYIEKLRERHFEIMRDTGKEESYEVYPDKYDEDAS